MPPRCVPGSRGFGFMGKPGCAKQQQLGFTRVQPRLSVQCLHLEAKPSSKDGGFFQVLLRKSDLNTSACGT